MPDTVDIAILGATAAGYVAAITCARNGRSVVLIDAPATPTESPLCDWIPADVVRESPVLKAVRSAGMDAAFRTVCFHSVDLAAQAVHSERADAGYVLHADRFLKALDALAGKAKVVRVRSEQPLLPSLQESGVVFSGPRPVSAKLLLICQGSPFEIITDLRLPVGNVPRGRLSVCGLDAPLPAGSVRNNLGKVLHVINYGAGERFGVFFAAGPTLHVRLIAAGTSAPTPAELGELLSRLQANGLAPGKLGAVRMSGAFWRPPGGVALELETHLTKRTLLVGTAGGFVSAMTGQTLDPSVRSAMVAAAIAEKALKSRQPQDVLAAYKSQWRDKLADRIRPTGTSLQMLMPMVLANKAMTRRFARAFLYGENF